MKTIHDWFDDYGQSHKNKVNKLIHWICIPLIFWSIIALFSLIPHDFLSVFKNSFINDLFHWGTVVIIFGLIFYLRLSFSIFLGMLLFSIFNLLHIYFTVFLFDLHHYWGLCQNTNINGEFFLFIISITVFIFAWILQFLGHKIEGKKPSFFKDLQFLLIGPAWIISFIYKKLGIKY